ncbi:MAG TPA: NAD(+)/NADH kinase [Acidimicrobiales bacterium]|nr:NAD(+)/NADH kinase [Acidimicrobiales bacterium]
MATVAFVPHPDRPAAADLAKQAGAWLAARGHNALVVLPDATLPDVDLVVSLGGDGTMLHSIGLVGAREIPLLGVNIGHLGYLTDVEPDGLITALERFFNGDHRLERRMILDVAANGVVRRALNEAVLEKTTSGHTVRLGLTIDGEPLVTYAADGLIVATPTGSTAYNLSVRGPICSPTHRGIVVTPVSAHMLFDRSLVLDADQVVGVEVLEGREARLVVDGQVVGLVTSSQRVELSASKIDAALVRFGPPDFNRVLRSKFGLADR